MARSLDALDAGSLRLDVEGFPRAAVASSFAAGLSSGPVAVLRESSGTSVRSCGNVVVRFAESKRSAADLRLITDLASVLVGLGVATPAPLGRCHVGPWEVSVWELWPPSPSRDFEGLGAALRSFHEVPLASLPALPAFSDMLDRGRARASALAGEVPGILRAWEASLGDLAFERVSLLHGDTNIGNVLWSRRVLLCDLECVSVGPPEWDLAKLRNDVVAEFGRAAFVSVLRGYCAPLDRAVFSACVRLDALKSTLWRVSEIDRGVSVGVPREVLVAKLRFLASCA